MGDFGSSIQNNQATVVLEVGELVIGGVAAGIKPLQTDGADLALDLALSEAAGLAGVEPSGIERAAYGRMAISAANNIRARNVNGV
jgi:hypothetical protein